MQAPHGYHCPCTQRHFVTRTEENHATSTPWPLRTHAFGPHAPGKRVVCAHRLARRAHRGRHAHPAHRGPRPAQDPCRCHRGAHRRPALARPRLGRGPRLPKRASGHIRAVRRPPRAHGPHLPVLLLARRAACRAGSPRKRRNAHLRRHLPHPHRRASSRALPHASGGAAPARTRGRRSRRHDSVYRRGLRRPARMPGAGMRRLPCATQRRRARLPACRHRRRRAHGCRLRGARPRFASLVRAPDLPAAPARV